MALFPARVAQEASLEAARRDSGSVVQPQFQQIVPVPIGSQVFINPDTIAATSPLPPSRVSHVTYGQLTFGRRARFTFWGNPLVRVLTLLWLLLLAVGIVLAVTSPTMCPSNCVPHICNVTIAGNRTEEDDDACLCGHGECREQILGREGQAGIALIVLAFLGIASQALFACPCCPCWLPSNPFYVQDQ